MLLKCCAQFLVIKLSDCLNMDTNYMNEPLESNTMSLHGLYTDFDNWIIRYNAFYRRFIRRPEENTNQKLENNSRQQISTDNLLIDDVFIADILMRQMNKGYTAKQPCVNCKENDAFIFYDHVLFRLMDKSGDRRIIYRIIRSKL